MESFTSLFVTPVETIDIEVDMKTNAVRVADVPKHLVSVLENNDSANITIFIFL